MHLAQLRLRDFRNYAQLDAEFVPGFHLLLGPNAQGKTNLLEALYLLVTLRSFRGVGSAQMVRHGAKAYFVGAKTVGQTEHEIKVYWSSRQRSLTLDGSPVRRLGDYFGTLRGVVFCTEDLQLIKGTSRVRRRFLDLLLAQTHPHYLPLIQRYAQALRARNAVLKQPTPDRATLASFTTELIKLGNEICEHRRALIPRVSPLVQAAYQHIAPQAEDLRLIYEPSIKADFATELAQSQAWERRQRSTVIGPHRDDLQLLLNEQPAAQFASEGQKRTLAIALKMAQAEFLTTLHGTPPILLIDDVMGELDAHRRAGLMPLLDQAHRSRGQVFMTCTEENWPRELGRSVLRWAVSGGKLVKSDEPRR